MNIRRSLLTAVFALTSPAAAYATYCGLLIWSGNFHAVVEGRFYRSGQLDKDGFSSAIETHHIRTILNLRGPEADQKWYQGELDAAREHGTQHYDVGISAYRIVPAGKLDEIIAILRSAPRPILVHCKSGADRTGLVSALYRYAIQGQSSESAAQELSLLYGHFPYLMSRSGAMDTTARAYFANHVRPASD
jgi:protein tyrosine/serine phosphatase